MEKETISPKAFFSVEKVTKIATVLKVFSSYPMSFLCIIIIKLNLDLSKNICSNGPTSI